MSKEGGKNRTGLPAGALTFLSMFTYWAFPMIPKQGGGSECAIQHKGNWVGQLFIDQQQTIPPLKLKQEKDSDAPPSILLHS